MEKIAGQARNLFHLRNSPGRPQVISINSFAEKMRQSGLRDFWSSELEFPAVRILNNTIFPRMFLICLR
jgi:hypothetical protein